MDNPNAQPMVKRYLPVIFVVIALIVAIITVSLRRECGPVSTAIPAAEREAALVRGDTLPESEQDGDLTKYDHVCTWK